jgi:hypothetical protein
VSRQWVACWPPLWRPIPADWGTYPQVLPASGGRHHLRVPIVGDATLDDAESIGEAHAEAWRIGYDELFSPAVLEPSVDLRRRMWVGLVGDPALRGTLLVAEEAEEVVGIIHFGPASGTAISVRSMALRASVLVGDRECAVPRSSPLTS